MNTLIEFWVFLGKRKKYWMWPFLALIILLSLFLFVAQSTALSTFIYSLF
ncbi:DUF5989 family protein [Mucilaginibacter sp. RS28]|uniref:DUF5989 family protein n=1 Tax=Mucilaginibacter straminoryzae TaxID=2932774 RepID=A0A9X1X2A0_9SPHI|nr:DUF5989 family protein [Mucilaginibacter straminoryzae]MCJ8209015.1 DUF5989 family protein [Mucilaginibacter straminoryzae]